VALLDPLFEAGYAIHLQKVNAASFGVPQHRKRVVLLAARSLQPRYLEPSHSPFGAPGAKLGARNLPRTPTLLEGLSGMPEPARKGPDDSEMTDHVVRQLRPEDAARARSLSPGQTMRNLPPHLQHSSYQRRANRRVMDGTPTERRGGAPAGLRRLIPDQPSKAITSSASSEFLHPFDDRFLTLRECARLQTFPDWFRFLGSYSERATLIGNAIPPLLGLAVGRALQATLRDARPRETPGQGELLSFVPTLSTGMSPALQNVTRRIRYRYGGLSTPTLARSLQLSLDA
jgi:DNA (cytosine-5)-methyltransferase 1